MKSAWLFPLVLALGCGQPNMPNTAPAPSAGGAAGSAGAPAIAELNSALEKKDAEAAGKAIASISDLNAAVPSLIRGLGNENSDVRETCSEALVQFAPKGDKVLLALIGALEDEDPVVRRHAATALGEIGPSAKPAVEALQQMEKNENEKDDGRKAATTALERINATN